VPATAIEMLIRVRTRRRMDTPGVKAYGFSQVTRSGACHEALSLPRLISNHSGLEKAWDRPMEET